MKTILRLWKPLLFTFIASILLLAVIMRGGYYGFHYNLVLGIIFFGLLTWFFRKKSRNSKEKILNTIVISTPILLFLGILLMRLQPFYTSPNFFFAPVIGVILALIYERLSSLPLKFIILLFPLFFGFWVYLSGADIWEHYIIYGSFSSGATLQEAPNMSFRKDTLELTNSDFRGKTVVLYFWNTTCPYSKRFFPRLKEKSEKWDQTENVEFYAVNFPVPSDKTGYAERVIKKQGINIPNLIGPNAEESWKVYGSFTFPLTLILNPEGKIVFKGAIDRIDKTLETLTEKIN